MRADALRPAAARPLAALAAGAALAALIAFLSTLGGTHDPVAGLAGVLFLLAAAGLPALAFLLGALGLGVLFIPLTREFTIGPWIRAGLGLALMLSLSHLLGALGLLSGLAGRAVAAIPVFVGLGLIAWRTGVRRSVHVSPAWLVALPALAVLLVAAAVPPGWLWESEFGGYDVLSYHLQLPQEWIALGRITPLEHNVYSFLPGYVEAAFVHLAALRGEGSPPSRPGEGWGLLGAEGTGVISCQMLHAGLALLAAGTTAAAARTLAARLLDAAHARAAGALAGALLLATPWVVVTGSMAYNEMGSAALAAAGLIAALDRAAGAARRGCVAGILVGAAIACKPSAAVTAVPVAIALLAWLRPAAGRLGAILALLAAAVAVNLPWLIRNALASGNPVFPALAPLLGSGHWSGEQVARFAGAHAYAGGLADRLMLALLPEPGVAGIARWRGLTHPQWLALFPAAAAGLILAARDPRTRALAGALGAGIVASTALWLALTHVQSRFLLGLAVPAVLGVALGGASAWSRGARPARAAILFAGAALVAFQSAATLLIFASQRSGEPCAPLLPGPGFFTGAALPDDAIDATPERYVNHRLPPGSRLYLLGDATPLYFFTTPLHNTTWDAWPLARAMRRAPGNPDEWTRAIRALGCTHVLVNFAELSRLARDGWSDPTLSPERVADWLRTLDPPVARWSGGARVLIELPPPGR